MQKTSVTFLVRQWIPVFICMLLSATCILSAQYPGIRYEDKIRIREAIRISAGAGRSVWTPFARYPFAMILVTDSTEYLIHHPHPAEGFTFIGFDSILQTNIYARPRVFSRFFGTAHTFNGIPCIVMGTNENLRTKSTQWVIKLLHERLHQCQQYDSSFLRNARNLNINFLLADSTFPYDDAEVNSLYQKYSRSMADALSVVGQPAFKKAFFTYQLCRAAFVQKLSLPQYNYFSYEVWMEGIPRYTEYKLAALLEKETPTKEFQKLPDYYTFEVYKEKVVKTESSFLNELPLKDGRSTTFYSIGYAEGGLLDAISKNWRSHYFKQFFIEKYFR